MNRMNNFLLMGSVALSGIVAFSACSSENDMGAEVNPTFDGKTVKTQFALNVPYGNTGTRMSAEATQQNRNFRGISNMKLLSLTATPAAGKTSTSLINLGVNTNAFESDGSDYTNQGRYIYRDVEIPIGTKHFVFYGKATGTETTTTAASDNLFEKGYLSNNLSGTTGTTVSLDNTNFALQKIKGSLDLSAATGTTTENYDKVLKALQEVTGTKVTEGATTIEWNNITTSATDMKLNHAEKLWDAFKTLKAGSANSVRKTLENLKTSAGVAALAEGEAPTANGDGLLKTLVKNIDGALTTLGDDNIFPADLNLPDGAVSVICDGTSKTWKFNSSVTMNENTIDYTKITYPASLDYFVSSPAKARNEASTGLTDGKWPTNEDWTKNQATWTDWGDEVKNTTRTIALERAIQYGVANLELTINAKTNKLLDNAIAKGHQVADQNVDVTGNKLVMTGVLIGGQPTKVEWDYEPKPGTDFDLTIYDKKMNGATATEEGINVPVGTASTSTYKSNYTLVLDNKNASTPTIYVAVELINKTGIDFYGADGMVPAGGKFYLIGKLDPSTATTGDNPNHVDRVFLKDYTTKANLTIKDLKNAYNVIPDLRSTAISVGLAVNLEWQTGITFNVEI